MSYNLLTGKEEEVFQIDSSRILFMDLSDDGRKIAYNIGFKKIFVYDLDTKKHKLVMEGDNSFQTHLDHHGNLLWSWNIPLELGQMSLHHKMRARAAIDIHMDKKPVGYFSIILPVHMGYVFIPRDVVESINKKGNQFEMKISLETRDKNNRTYSKSLLLKEKIHMISDVR